MFKTENKKAYNFSIFNLFPLYAERLRRIVKYGRLHNKIYGGK